MMRSSCSAIQVLTFLLRHHDEYMRALCGEVLDRVFQIRDRRYEVVVVSPRNYFLMTPLLPGITVGTVEVRSIVAPIRSLLPGALGDAKYCAAQAVGLDAARRTLMCEEVCPAESHLPFPADRGVSGPPPMPFQPTRFELPYDKLVVAVGAPCNTFGTTGVTEHTHFLKEAEDGQIIRRKLFDAFELAALPSTRYVLGVLLFVSASPLNTAHPSFVCSGSAQDKKLLTSVVVVGGGPTGTEFAAELHDFLEDDVPRLYPELKGIPSITIVQSADHILNTFDKRISEFAEKKFARDGIRFAFPCVSTLMRVTCQNRSFDNNYSRLCLSHEHVFFTCPPFEWFALSHVQSLMVACLVCAFRWAPPLQIVEWGAGPNGACTCLGCV